MKHIYLLSTSLYFLIGCAHQKSVNETIKPPESLEEVYQMARKTSNLRSFLVWRDQELIGEEYFDRYSGDSLDHVRSVTKSVMATLIGIAIDQGIIEGVNDPIGKYIEVPINKQNITIHHLLTMTSGIRWNEGANAEGYGAWSSSPNELKYVLDKPMADKPGTVWNYNSGAIHILSAILTEAAGMNTLKFARKYLFEPLEINRVRWEKQADGYYNGAAGLELRPRDMVKLGQLYMNKGLYHGKRVLSASFIEEAISHQEPDNMSLEAGSGYGYCWWLGEEDQVSGYAALGYGGQIILIERNTNIIIVLTHNWRGINGHTASEQDRKGLNVLAIHAVLALMEE